MIAQDFPGQQGHLSAGQARHDRVQIALDLDRLPLAVARHPAGRLQRIGQHDQRAFIAEPPLVERGHRRRHAAHAGLQEDMRRRFVQRVQRLLRHDLVALHDVARHVQVARIRGVGDDEPPFPRRGLLRLAQAVVIGAGDAPHLGPVACDRLAPRFRDMGMDVDHAARPEPFRPPGDGPAMIAVGRAADGDLAGFGMGLLDDLLHGDRTTQPVAQLRLQQTRHRIGPAKRLERPKAKARRLVLVPDLGDAELRRHLRQFVQRRRRIARPAGDRLARGHQPGFGQDRVLRLCPIRVDPAQPVRDKNRVPRQDRLPSENGNAGLGGPASSGFRNRVSNFSETCNQSGKKRRVSTTSVLRLIRNESPVHRRPARIHASSRTGWDAGRPCSSGPLPWSPAPGQRHSPGSVP